MKKSPSKKISGTKESKKGENPEEASFNASLQSIPAMLKQNKAPGEQEKETLTNKKNPGEKRKQLRINDLFYRESDLSLLTKRAVPVSPSLNYAHTKESTATANIRRAMPYILDELQKVPPTRIIASFNGDDPCLSPNTLTPYLPPIPSQPIKQKKSFSDIRKVEASNFFSILETFSLFIFSEHALINPHFLQFFSRKAFPYKKIFTIASDLLCQLYIGRMVSLEKIFLFDIRSLYHSYSYLLYSDPSFLDESASSVGGFEFFPLEEESTLLTHQYHFFERLRRLQIDKEEGLGGKKRGLGDLGYEYVFCFPNPSNTEIKQREISGRTALDIFSSSFGDYADLNGTAFSERFIERMVRNMHAFMLLETAKDSARVKLITAASKMLRPLPTFSVFASKTKRAIHQKILQELEVSSFDVIPPKYFREPKKNIMESSKQNASGENDKNAPTVGEANLQEQNKNLNFLSLIRNIITTTCRFELGLKTELHYSLDGKMIYLFVGSEKKSIEYHASHKGYSVQLDVERIDMDSSEPSLRDRSQICELFFNGKNDSVSESVRSAYRSFVQSTVRKALFSIDKFERYATAYFSGIRERPSYDGRLSIEGNGNSKRELDRLREDAVFLSYLAKMTREKYFKLLEMHENIILRKDAYSAGAGSNSEKEDIEDREEIKLLAEYYLIYLREKEQTLDTMEAYKTAAIKFSKFQSQKLNGGNTSFSIDDMTEDEEELEARAEPIFEKEVLNNPEKRNIRQSIEKFFAKQKCTGDTIFDEEHLAELILMEAIHRGQRNFSGLWPSSVRKQRNQVLNIGKQESKYLAAKCNLQNFWDSIEIESPIKCLHARYDKNISHMFNLRREGSATPFTKTETIQIMSDMLFEKFNIPFLMKKGLLIDFFPLSDPVLRSYANLNINISRNITYQNYHSKFQEHILEPLRGFYSSLNSVPHANSKPSDTKRDEGSNNLEVKTDNIETDNNNGEKKALLKEKVAVKKKEKFVEPYEGLLPFVLVRCLRFVNTKALSVLGNSFLSTKNEEVYFGTSIGEYFHFIRHFCFLLLTPAVIGAIIEFFRHYADDQKVFLDIIRILNATFICLWSVTFLRMWQIKQETQQLHTGHLLSPPLLSLTDNPRSLNTNVTASITNSTTGASKEAGEQEELWFAAKTKETAYGELRKYITPWNRRLRIFLTSTLSIVYILIPIVFTCTIELLKPFLYSSEWFVVGIAGERYNYTLAVTTVMNTLQVLFFNGLYRMIAVRLCNFEKHTSRQLFLRSFAVKCVGIELVTSYFLLFWIAFLKGRWSYLIRDVEFFADGDIGNSDSERRNGIQCLYGNNCAQELNDSLLILSLVFLVKNLIELGWPYIRNARLKRRLKHKLRIYAEKIEETSNEASIGEKDEKVTKGSGEDKAPHSEENPLKPLVKKKAISDLVFLAETDFHKSQFGKAELYFDSLQDEYLELAITYGYFALFSINFPGAGVLQLISLLIELLVDNVKLNHLIRRPHPIHGDNQIWNVIFNTITYISILINAAMLVWTTPLSSLYDSIDVRRFSLFTNDVDYLSAIHHGTLDAYEAIHGAVRGREIYYWAPFILFCLFVLFLMGVRKVMQLLLNNVFFSRLQKNLFVRNYLKNLLERYHAIKFSNNKEYNFIHDIKNSMNQKHHPSNYQILERLENEYKNENKLRASFHHTITTHLERRDSSNTCYTNPMHIIPVKPASQM